MLTDSAAEDDDKVKEEQAKERNEDAVDFVNAADQQEYTSGIPLQYDVLPSQEPANTQVHTYKIIII